MRLRSISLTSKVVGIAICGFGILSCSLLLVSELMLNAYAGRMAMDRQDVNVRVAWDAIHKYGRSFRSEGGILYIDNHPLNDFNELVDHVKQLVGGTATLFLGDRRIATNVLKDDGTRAVGTTLTPGPVYETVLQRGQPFRGETEIFGETFLTAYDPIRDTSGRVVGILYVGVPKAEFFAAVNRTQNLILGICVVVTLVTGAASYGLLRRMFSPLASPNTVSLSARTC